MTEFYVLTRVKTDDTPGRIATAAFLSCGTCGRMIDGMGGGATGICIPCGDRITRGEARNALPQM